jgi:hypothetical protein
VIAAVEKEYQLFDTFFANLRVYHQHVKQELAKLPSQAQDVNSLLVGKWQHLQQIRERFEFLDFTLGNSDLSLTPQQLDALWQSTVVQGLTVEERDLGLQWIETSRSTTNNKEYASLSDESIEYIFDHKFAELDFATLTMIRKTASSEPALINGNSILSPNKTFVYCGVFHPVSCAHIN